MIQTPEFQNQTVLVTGASAGIGAAAAHAFGSRGAHVIVHYNSRREAAEQVVAGIQSAGGSGETVQADLAAAAGVRSLVDWLHDRPVDILVNNAGSLVRRTRVLEFTPELMEQVMLLNFTSAFFVAQAVLPGMVERRRGAIVNVSSVAARFGGGIGALAYSAAKAALSAMTKNMAREFAPSGIRVNTVSPGTIDTDYHRAFSTEQMLTNVKAATPMGRLGTAEEVADAIVFLCSAGARFIQGQALEVNGGVLMVWARPLHLRRAPGAFAKRAFKRAPAASPSFPLALRPVSAPSSTHLTAPPDPRQAPRTASPAPSSSGPISIDAPFIPASRGELTPSLSQLPHPSAEMPQERRRFHDLHPPDPLLILVHFQNRFHHVIDVALRVHPPRNRQAQQLVPRRLAEHQAADLHAAYPRVPVQFHGQRLPRKLRRRYVRQHARRVDINGVPSRRLHNRDPAVRDVPPQVARGLDPVVQIILVQHFLQTHRDGVQVAPRQAAVGRETLGENQQVGLLQEHPAVVGAQ